MTRSAPRVTVITIFLNAETFIREAIDSVLAQRYDDWELLLVDDGSTDASTGIALDFAARFPDRIRYLEHPLHRNRGMSPSRNLGIQHARGAYLAFLDADDVWLPLKLERQVAILDAQPEASMVYGATEYWYSWAGESGDAGGDRTPELGIPPDVLYRAPALTTLLHPLGNGTAPCPSDLMIRRGLIDAIGGFEENFSGSNQLFEDQAFLAKVYLHAGVFASSETWDKYRIHPDSCSSQVERSGEYESVRRFFLQWLEKYLRRARIENPSIEAALAQARAEEPGRWRLRTAEGAVASLIVPSGAPHTIRVAIETTPSGTGYDVQLNLPRLRVQSGRSYAVRFRARADRPRDALAGVAEAHAPWEGLGWHQRFALTTEWQDFGGEFVALRDDDNARVHFDLGESAIPVELMSVELLNMDDGPAADPPRSTGGTSALFGELRRLTPLSRNWGFDRGTPIDRYYLEGFLAREAMSIRGRVLEIEDNGYTLRFGGERVTRSDVLHVTEGNPKATLVGDLTRADHLPSDAFDCVVLTQTLHLIYDTRAALRTLHRILKPGGVLLATFPGLSRTSHEEWEGLWYWGFTSASAGRLFKEAFDPGPVRVESLGNVLTAISFLHGVAAEELRQDELDHRDPDYEVLIVVRATK